VGKYDVNDMRSKNMQIRNFFVSVLLVVMIPFLEGCALFLVGASVAAGIGTAAYVNGELSVSEEVGVDKTFKATVSAMNELEFKVTEQQKDAVSGKVIAKMANGTIIRIYVHRETDRVTVIRIRVGTFGDEALSKLIHDKIRKNL
jgi:hypothetical protein